MAKFGDKFRPRQLGFGVKEGAEAAVHSARAFLEQKDGDILVKLDFKNAFNCVRQDRMLEISIAAIPDQGT